MKKGIRTGILILMLLSGFYWYVLHSNTLKSSNKEIKIKVVTYNVNWGGGNSDKVIEYLRTVNADFVCLQETNQRWETLIQSQLKSIYPFQDFHHSGGAGGIATISKYSIAKTRIIEAKEGWFPAQLLTIKSDLGNIQMLNVHLKPALSDKGSVSVSAYYKAPKVHMKELAHFMSFMEKGTASIILGDFNENTRKNAIKHLLGNGYSDALTIFDKKTETWSWKTSAGFSLKNRYDHILFNEKLKCLNANVTKVKASDHYPVYAEFLYKEKNKSEEINSPNQNKLKTSSGY